MAAQRRPFASGGLPRRDRGPLSQRRLVLLLVLTGSFNLWFRGVRLSDFGRAEWLASPFGKTVVVKLGVFLAVLAISAVHDFRLGPQATRAIAADPTSVISQRARRQASWLGRLNVLLALVLIAAGVMLVRGVPW